MISFLTLKFNLKPFVIDCVSYLMILGPDIPELLSGHSMVALGLGQAIIGGKNDLLTTTIYSKKIYHLERSRGDFAISRILSELSIPLASFMAIPIPEFFSGCISEGET